MNLFPQQSRLLVKLTLLIMGFAILNAAWWDDYPAVQLTKQNIDEVIGVEQHVYLKFFTPWCHWCQTMAPDWGQIYQLYHQTPETRKDVTIAKVNCQTDPEVCNKFHVHSYPVVYYFPINTREPEHGFSGYRPFDHIKHFIEETIGDQSEHNRLYHDNRGNHDHQHAHQKHEEDNQEQQQEKRRIEQQQREQQQRIRREQLEIARQQQEQRIRRAKQDADRREQERLKIEEQERKKIQQRILSRQAEQLELEQLRINKEKEAGKKEFKVLSDGPVDTQYGSVNGQLHSVIKEIALLKTEINELQSQSDTQMESLNDKMHVVGQELKQLVHPENEIKQQNINESKHHIVNWTHATIFIMTGTLIGVIIGCMIKPDGKKNAFLPEQNDQ